MIYVNFRKQEDTELGRLMHDLHCKDANEMYNEILAKQVYELKETQERVDIMCREMDQIYNEGIAEGIAEGIEVGELKKAKETAISLAGMGVSIDRISQAVKVSVKVVQGWIDESMSLAR